MHELNVLLKIEFKRLFKNKLFYISLFIGVVLATGSFINKVIPHMDILNGFDGSVASYPFSVFNHGRTERERQQDRKSVV